MIPIVYVKRRTWLRRKRDIARAMKRRWHAPYLPLIHRDR
jgi:hypothetical protein